MPLHFEDLDVVSEAKGSKSALIVPCNMCPAATVADRENKPFLRLFKDFLKSAPFEKYIAALQNRLRRRGVRSKVFKKVVCLTNGFFVCGQRLDRESCKDMPGDMTRLLSWGASRQQEQFVIQ